jgi:hypothetical protein
MKLAKFVLITSCAFALAACNPSSNTSNIDPDAFNLGDVDNQYAFVAYTGALSLDQIEAPAVQSLKVVDEETDPDEELATVNRYLNLYKQLTESGALDVVTEETSNRPEYVFQVTITTTDIDLIETTFTLYFNEAVIDVGDDIDGDVDDTGETEYGETEMTPVEDGYVYRNRNEERNIEDSTLLVGLLVTSEEEIAITGYRLVEEDSVRLIFRACLDDGRVVRISHISDATSQRFNYFVRDGRTLIVQKKMVLKVEDNKTVLKLTDTKDGVTEKYAFKRVELEDSLYYVIRYVTPEEKGLIHIYVSEDDLGNEVLEYHFSNGKMYYHDGDGNHGGQKQGSGSGSSQNGGAPDYGEDSDYDDEFSDMNF